MLPGVVASTLLFWFREGEEVKVRVDDDRVKREGSKDRVSGVQDGWSSFVTANRLFTSKYTSTALSY